MTSQFTLPRRQFLESCAMAGAAPLIRRIPLSRIPLHGDDAPVGCLLDVTTRQALALRAIDAAMAAGARYADVRLTYTRTRSLTPTFGESEELGIGVRALVDGYWGFASSPYWAPDAVSWLGQHAVTQAQANGARPVRVVELGTIPKIVDGSWQTPVKIDPFETPVEDIFDWMAELNGWIGAKLPKSTETVKWQNSIILFSCWQQEQVFASSEGNSYTQKCTQVEVEKEIKVQDLNKGVEIFRVPQVWGRAGMGVELAYDNADAVRAWVIQSVDEMQQLLSLPKKQVEPGRSDVILDARSMGSLVANAFGDATQLDRALGYEANAGGSSFLGPDPMKFLGTPLAMERVSVIAGRSHPGDLATVGWDAEGTPPRDFPLIEAGKFVDYQTTREQASWLAPYYGQRNGLVQSHACLTARSALDLPMQHTPNITLSPGQQNLQLPDLVASMKKGILMRNGKMHMDFQRTGGIADGEMYEIKNGRPSAILVSGGGLFKTTELLKNIQSLGGVASREWCTAESEKGEPSQSVPFTVWTVPALVEQMAIIDVTKKA